jgi:hypothetical protein
MTDPLPGLAISIQVTFDGGSELGWLASFQTTLRYFIFFLPFYCHMFIQIRQIFAPELTAEEWKPILAVQSSINIPIESTWSYDRQFNGCSLRNILEDGRIHLTPGDLIHRYFQQFNFVKSLIPCMQESLPLALAQDCPDRPR